MRVSWPDLPASSPQPGSGAAFSGAADPLAHQQARRASGDARGSGPGLHSPSWGPGSGAAFHGRVDPLAPEQAWKASEDARQFRQGFSKWPQSRGDLAVTRPLEGSELQGALAMLGEDQPLPSSDAQPRRKWPLAVSTQRPRRPALMQQDEPVQSAIWLNRPQRPEDSALDIAIPGISEDYLQQAQQHPQSRLQVSDRTSPAQRRVPVDASRSPSNPFDGSDQQDDQQVPSSPSAFLEGSAAGQAYVPGKWIGQAAQHDGGRSNRLIFQRQQSLARERQQLSSSELSSEMSRLKSLLLPRSQVQTPVRGSLDANPTGTTIEPAKEAADKHAAQGPPSEKIRSACDLAALHRNGDSPQAHVFQDELADVACRASQPTTANPTAQQIPPGCEIAKADLSADAVGHPSHQAPDVTSSAVRASPFDDNMAHWDDMMAEMGHGAANEQSPVPPAVQGKPNAVPEAGVGSAEALGNGPGESGHAGQHGCSDPMAAEQTPAAGNQPGSSPELDSARPMAAADEDGDIAPPAGPSHQPESAVKADAPMRHAQQQQQPQEGVLPQAGAELETARALEGTWLMGLEDGRADRLASRRSGGLGGMGLMSRGPKHTRAGPGRLTKPSGMSTAAQKS